MRRRHIFKSFVFAIVIVAILLGAGETAIRIAGINPRVDNPFFMLVRVYEYPEYFEKDHTLFWRLKKNVDQGTEFLVPGVYRTNSLGLRGGEIDPDTLGDRERIACFGNSCTFGWSLSESEAYPEALQLKLAARTGGDRHVVFNCGVPGYSSYQGVKMLERYLPILKPDIVTICYGWNDHWAAGFDIPDKDQKMPSQLLLHVQNLLSQSYLYRSVKYLLLAGYEKRKEYTFNRESPVYRVSVEDYRTNLIEMVRICRSNKIEPIFITAPIGDVDPTYDQPYEIYHGLYNEIVRQVSSEYRVSLLDAAAAFTKHPEFFDDPNVDYIHYNKLGADWIALHLTEIIAPSPAQ
jgi:lysophospholipase L1-like esterase